MKKRMFLITMLVAGLSFQHTHTKNIKDVKIGKLPTLREVETLTKNIDWLKLVQLTPKLFPLIKNTVDTLRDPELKEALKNILSSISELKGEFDKLKSSKLKLSFQETADLSLETIESLFKLAGNTNSVLNAFRKITDEVVDDLVGVLKDTEETEKLKKFIENVKAASDQVTKVLDTTPDLIKALKQFSQALKLEQEVKEKIEEGFEEFAKETNEETAESIEKTIEAVEKTEELSTKLEDVKKAIMDAKENPKKLDEALEEVTSATKDAQTAETLVKEAAKETLDVPTLPTNLKGFTKKTSSLIKTRATTPVTDKRTIVKRLRAKKKTMQGN